MKRLNFTAVSTIALVASVLVGGNAIAATAATAAKTAKVGGTCATASATTTIAGKSYSCVKALSGKLVWTLKSSSALGGAAKPSIAGGAAGGPSDEGSAADIARHAAMKKYSDCLVAHGGTAMTLGGPGGSGGFHRAGGLPGQPPAPGQPGQTSHMGPMGPMGANEPAAALTACASLAPKFGGPGFGGHHDFSGAQPAPSASANTQQ